MNQDAGGDARRPYDNRDCTAPSGAVLPCPRSPDGTAALECLGSLTGRIAHDFNNLLCVMLANAELARLAAGPNRVLLDYLELVTLAGDRAKDLVRQVLTLTRRQNQERRPVSLSGVVREVLKLVRSSLPPAVDVASFVEEDLPPVAGDPIQLHQVAMNLCTNALHAMSEMGGRLSVRLDRCGLPAAGDDTGLPPGDYARLIVSDTGHGMDEETRRRIFEPFFSTKPAGEGTGLGLTVVQGIVSDHAGAVCVASRQGLGTTFTVYFPIFSAAA